MTGTRTLLSRVIGRTAVGLLTAAAVVWLAPVATATPESDADGAITQAWDANGGPTGPLGPKDGGVYPVGEGFGQNFAGGKIFFTPDTGAHIMHGVILAKYESLGGPADSDLGWPTIDEGPGRIGPDSRNSTFSAGDKPVIFWTPDTGARVVRGAINAAWDKLGGSAGPLGVPVEDESHRGDVVAQKFSGGELSWNRQTKAFTTVPADLVGQLAGLAVPEDPTSAINAARRAAGGPLGPLGAEKGPPYEVGSDGFGQDFAGGKIFYSPATGAHVVTGQVLAKYESVGGPEGDLGFPTSSEADGGLEPASRVSAFAAEDKPVIFWTPDHGAVIVRGAMNAAWTKLGGATGELGAPEADQTANGDVITQRFTGGEVSWNSSTDTFTTQPPNLASSLAGLEVPGKDLPEAPDAPSAADTDDDGWVSRWWWLLVLVPLLLALLGLGLWMALRNRGPGADAYYAMPGDAQFGKPDDAEHGVDALGAYAPVATVGQPTAGGQDHDPFTRPRGWGFGTGTVGVTADESVDEVSQGEDDDAFALQDDPDAVDTAPTRIETDEGDIETDEGDIETDEGDVEPEEGDIETDEGDIEPEEGDIETDEGDIEPEEGDIEPEEPPLEPDEPLFEPDEEIQSGRHAATEVEDPTAIRTAFHLPLEDPYEVPDGYPVKADTRSGVYWTPGSDLYDEVLAEIWFVSEEFARTNGFIRAD